MLSSTSLASSQLSDTSTQPSISKPRLLFGLLCEGIDILKLQLPLFDNGKKFFSNKLIFAMSLIAISLQGTFLALEAMSFGKILQLFTTEISTEKMPNKIEYIPEYYGIRFQKDMGTE